MIRPRAATAIGSATITSETANAATAIRGMIRQPYSRVTSGDRQKPLSSHNRCAPSMAANSAPTTPTPRPATTSILTPASCSARSTPAWYAPAVPVPLRTSAVRSCGEYGTAWTSPPGPSGPGVEAAPAGSAIYASSWIVCSLRISNSRVPPGVTTFTESPSSLFRNARPMGDVVDTRPLAASASSGMTS